MKPSWLLNNTSLLTRPLENLRGRLRDRIASCSSKENNPLQNTRPQRKNALFMEPLEPRLLLNADLPLAEVMVAPGDHQDRDIVIRMVEDAENHTGPGDASNVVQIVDVSNGEEILATADLNTLSVLTLNLGDGDDTITIDTLSFGEAPLPKIIIDAGEGNDEIVLLGAGDTNWDITGDDAGSVSGGIDLEFAAVENLTGSADNEDHFTLTAGANLSGELDGGDGGYDVLTIQGDFVKVTSTVFSGSSGVMDIDGRLVTYTGLEPVTLAGDVTQFILTGTNDNDQVVLEEGAVDGTFQLRSDTGSFETHIFSNSVQTIVIGLAAGDDSFTSTLTDNNPFVGNITISETTDLTLGNITGLDGNFTVDTRSASHAADGNTEAWDGSSVVISDSATIDITGDFSITVNATAVLDAANIQEWINLPNIDGSLVVGDGATIAAAAVTLNVVTSDDREAFIGIDTQALIEIAMNDAKVAEASGWGTISFSDNGDGTATVTRSSGSWIDDGFADGQDIQFFAGLGNLNHAFAISAVNSATQLTITLPDGAALPGADEIETDGLVVTGYAFVRLTGNDVINFGANGGVAEITRLAPDSNPAHVIGSFIDDGFQVGDLIIVDGSNSNNGTYTIAAVHADRLVLEATDSVVDEVVDLSVVNPAALIIQKVNDELAIEDLPLVLLDADGNPLETAGGGPLQFTQGELETAFDGSEARAEDMLGWLADNPVTDVLLGYGFKVWISNLSGSVTVGSNADISASGDIIIGSDVTANVNASTPSIVLGVSVVSSDVSSTVDILSGAEVAAGGELSVSASANNSMTSDMSVTSGSIQNPAQPIARGVIAGGGPNGEGTSSDPTGFANFATSTIGGSFLGPLGFVRVPGPSVAVALGMADTDSSVTIASGSSVRGDTVDIAASNTDNYAVSSSATIFAPGTNMGIAVAAAVSVTDSDSVVNIAGDVEGSAGNVTISADSINESNSVSSAAWVRDSAQGGGGLLGVMGGFPTDFSKKIKAFQNGIRDATALTGLDAESPGEFEIGAGFSVLVSHNDADVIISSTEDDQGNGGVVAAGDLSVSTRAEENPSVGAAGTSESGATVSVGGGIAYAQYNNDATTTISAGADLTAGGALSLTADAIIPNQVTLDETFYGNFKDAIDKKNQAVEDARGLEDEAELIAEAEATYNEEMSAAAKGVVEFLYGVVANRKWGFAGAEGGLFTSYVNSGAGGEYKGTGAEQSTEYAVAGNVNILDFHNQAEVIVEDGAEVEAVDALDISSNAEMESINVTGLTSLWDIYWSLHSRFSSNYDDGASTSGSAGGVGASIGIRIFDNTARNKIYGNVRLTSQDDSVTIEARTRDMHINLHEMGTDGGKFGISGVVSVDVIDITTESLVDESAMITAGADVNITAGKDFGDEQTTDFLQVNAVLAGSETTGGSAIGAGIGVNIVNSTTRAEVTDLDNNVADNIAVVGDSTLANIQAGGALNILADREEDVIAVTLAGASLKNEAEPDTGDSDDPFDGVGEFFDMAENWANDAKDKKQGSTGVGVAGSVLVDVSETTVTAAIGEGASVNADGVMTIDASQDRLSVMITGGGVLDKSVSGSKAAIGGAVDVSVFTRNVDALVSGAVIYASDMNVTADREDLMVAITAGGAGSARGKLAIGGAVNVNLFDNNVHAKVSNSQVDVAGDATVKARSKTLLATVAGGVGVTLTGKVGIGGGVTVSNHDDEVHAYIDNSTVDAGGNVLAQAHNELDIISLAVSGAASQGVSIAGQVAVHVAGGDIDARIGAGSDINAGNNVAVVADDDIFMTLITGGLSLGKNVSVGIAFGGSFIGERKVQAHIDDGAEVTADAAAAKLVVMDVAGGSFETDGVSVHAIGDDTIINIAVGVSVSASNFSGQGSIAVDTNDTDVLAYVGSDAGTAGNYAQVDTKNGGDIDVIASYDVLGVTVVGGISAGGSVAVGASVHVTSQTRDVKATTGAFADLRASGSVNLDAMIDNTLVTVVFNGGLSKSVSLSGAVSVPVLTDTVTAKVGSNGYVSAGDDIGIIAEHELDFVVVDATLAAGGTAGAGVSAGVLIQNATTHAIVGDNAELKAEDTIVVDASSEATIGAGVGGAAIGGTAGAGASALVLIRTDDVLASIGSGAMVTGLAAGAGFTRANPRTNSSETYSGVAVLARSWEDIVGVAFQGGGGGTAGIAGSAVVSVISETTKAHIGTGASVNQAEGTAGTDQDVIVRATDDTFMVNVAGNVAGGGTAGVGASADIGVITKTTEAAIETALPGAVADDGSESASVQANRDIRIEAFSSEGLVSVAAGVAIGGTAGVGLNASVYVANIDTIAKVGAGATVTAEGSVIVDAAQDTESDIIVASLAGSGAVAAGGSIIVPVFDKTVKAYIDQGANVTGKGLRAGLSDIHTGNVISAEGSGGASMLDGDGDLIAPSDTPDGSLNISAPSMEGAEDGMFIARDFSAEMVSDTGGSFKGVSVTASNVDDMMTISGVIAGAGTAAVGAGASVNIMNAHTEAYIGSDAVVNVDNIDHGADQSVTVAAGSAYDHLGVVVAGGGSGGVSVMGVAHAVVANLDTLAHIDGADVNARKNIAVKANAFEDVQSIGIALAGGLYAGVAPAATVIVLDATTHATIGGGSALDSAGNILLSATDTTYLDQLTTAIGAGAGGVGAGVDVALVDKSTEAVIDTGAVVDARALIGEGIETLSGEAVDLNDTEIVQGLVVDARSFENIDVVAAGGGGGIVGVGGAVSVQLIDADTKAAIEGGAVINSNPNNRSKGDSQDVSVVAYDQMDLFIVTGGVGVGLVGVGGGVNVSNVNNDTTAYIAGDVSAEDRISIAALSDQDFNGVIFSGAGGAVGAAAAISVVGLGGDLSGSYSYVDKDGNTQNASAFDDDKDPQSDINDSLGGVVSDLTESLSFEGETSEDDGSAQASSALNSALGSAESELPSSTSTQSAPILAGTTAFVGQNATIDAGADLDIDARQDADILEDVGGVAIGAAAGLAGGIGVTNIDNNVSSYIASGSVVDAGGNIFVSADLDQDATITAFAGAGSLFASISAAIAVTNDSSDVSSWASGNIRTASTITVDANSNIKLDTETVQVSAALFGVAGGAAVTVASVSGETTAYIGEKTQIGLDGEDGTTTDVTNLTLSATSTITMDDPNSNGMATGGSVGAVAGSAGVAYLTDNTNTYTYVGAGSDIRLDGQLKLDATSISSLTAKAYGGSAGLIAVGAMIGRTNVTSNTTAQIRGREGMTTNIDVGNLDVDSFAKSFTFVDTVSGSIGLIGGRGSSSETMVDVDSDASIGSNVNITADGDVSVVASSSIEGDTKARSGGGGLVDVGVTIAHTKITEHTTASVGTGSTILSGGNIEIGTAAGELPVPYDPIIGSINTDDEIIFMNGEHGLVTGDLIQYSGFNASIDEGRAYRVIQVDSGSLQLGEFFQMDSADNDGDGSLDVGVDTVFDVIRFDSTHSFQNGDRVQFQAPGAYEIGATGIDADLDEVDLAQHGLTTGDMIRYDAGDQTIDGLISGTSYYVVVIDSDTVKLSSSLTDAQNGTAIDLASSGLGVHQFTPQLETGFEEGTAYIVKVIDEYLIKVLPVGDDAPSQTFAPEDVMSGDRFDIDGHGFENGDAVTYHAPRTFEITRDLISIGSTGSGDEKVYSEDATQDTLFMQDHGLSTNNALVYSTAETKTITFASSAVDGTADVPATDDDPAHDSDDTDAITITSHGFVSGQTVVYHMGTTAIGGLVDNMTYYVSVVDDNSIKLSAIGGGSTINLTSSGIGTHSFDTADTIGDLIDGESYTVVKVDDHLIKLEDGSGNIVDVNRTGIAEDAVHIFAIDGEVALDGLVEGQTYYIVDATTDSFSIAETSGGAALGLNGSDIRGTHSFAVEGIDMNRGWGSGSLVIDITRTTGGTLLGGSGGALADSISLPGDNKSSATAKGFGVSAAGGASNEYSVNITSTVSTTVNASSLVTTTSDNSTNGDISLFATSLTSGTTTGNTFSIGLFGGGKSTDATTTVDDTVSITVSGNTVLNAAGDVDIDTEVDHEWKSYARSEGGGLIDIALADAQTWITVTNNVTFGDGAEVYGDGIYINTDVGGRAEIEASVSNGGLGANASADENSDGAKFTATTTIAIGAKVIMEADHLQIVALGSGMQAIADGDIRTGGFGTDGDAIAAATLASTQAITIGAGAQLTGNYGVVLRAQNSANTAWGKAYAKSYSLFGDTDAKADVDLNLTATVTGAAGATIYAGPSESGDQKALWVQAVERDNTYYDNANQSGGLFDGGSESEPGSKTINSTITWNSDVFIHTGAMPKLVVDENGIVTEAVNVSVNGGDGVGTDISGDTIYVDDIDTHQYGQIVFNSVASTGIEAVNGSGGTFHLLDTYSSVFIENRSDEDIVVQNIDVQADNLKTYPDVVIDTAINSLSFAVSESGLPTLVDIHNFTASDLTFKGLVENSKGDTIVLNEGGSILSANARGDIDAQGREALIITNTLDMDAPEGSIGADGQYVNVDMVDYGDRPAEMRVDAGGNIFLDLGARARNVASSSDMTLQVDHIQAGESINFILQQGVREQVVLSAGFVEVESKNGSTAKPTESGYVTTHYRNNLTSSKPTQSIGGTVIDSKTVPTTYLFEDGASTGTAGLIAGSDLNIVSADADTASSAMVHVYGYSDTGAAGVTNILTSGFVDLTEVAGNMNVGRIESRFGDVTLTVQHGDLLDAFEDADADVIGNNITFFALEGVMGGMGESDPFRSLDIDSGGENGGVLNATALGDIYLIETNGTVLVDKISTATGNVRLTTTMGSILDASDDGLADIEATNIDLIASQGSIGENANDLEINSSFSGAGRLFAVADNGIAITETAAALYLLRAESRTGSVRLRTPDTTLVSMEDGEGAGEDIIMLAGGTTLLGETVDYALVSGSTTVTMEIGDNFFMEPNSVIEAGSMVTLRGDHGDADMHYGTHMLLQGEIRPTDGFDGYVANIYGNDDADEFKLIDLFLGGATNIHGSNAETTDADADGEDHFMIDRLHSMTSSLQSHADNTVTGYALSLDGQSGTDHYEIYTMGSDTLDEDGLYSDYVINVLDSGHKADGSDVLEIYGSETTSEVAGNDIFLLRRMDHIPGEENADDPGMVALLHGSLEQTRTASGDEADRPQAVERINYDSNINGRVSVFGLSGEDFFASDDTSAIVTLDGGDGDDSFQIGQLYGDKRTSGLANLGPADEFGTLSTTRGELSRGTSMPMVVVGGDGNDNFTVYSNQAELRLEGNDGDDLFTIRAFALAAGADDDFSTAAHTDLLAGAGDDEVRYNINAPLSIDGGDGFDKVIAIGTEFDDSFVITDEGIYGAGLNITLSGNEEVREVDGIQGDDTFYVISTPYGINTRIIGGLGSDTVNISGDVTEDIVSRELEGLSGVINHGPGSDAGGTNYENTVLGGIDLHVADVSADAGLVVIEESAGNTSVSENGLLDVYTIRLAAAPAEGSVVYVNVSASRGTQSEEDSDTVWIGSAEDDFTRDVWVDGTIEERENRDLVLVFTADNWDQAQSVYIMAPDDVADEGSRVITINHSTSSTDERFDQTDVQNVEVLVKDNDRAEIHITEINTSGDEDRESRVLEGADGAEVSDQYELSLSRAPADGEIVKIYLGFDGEIALSSDGIMSDNNGSYVAFDSSNWDQAVIITINAKDDFVTDGNLISLITHSVVSDGAIFAGVASETVDVTVLDNETPGLFITESDGNTIVVRDQLGLDNLPQGLGEVDTYSLRLTAAPTGPVTINLITDGQTDIVLGDRVFLNDIGTAETGGLFGGVMSFIDGGADADTIVAAVDWGALGFKAGHMIRIDSGANTGVYKIESIAGGIVTLTANAELTNEANVDTSVIRVSAAVTFTPENYHEAVTVTAEADPYYAKPEDQRFNKEFPANPHDLSLIQGPVEVIGGETEARSLFDAVILPGEWNSPLPELEESNDPDDLMSIDTLNVYDDSVFADREGVLTGTSLNGFGLADSIHFDHTAFGEPSDVPGGITYGDAETGTSTFEVFNFFMGQGNDSLTIESTLLTDAEHGGITNIHGGGNRDLSVTGNFTLAGDGDSATLTRLDGADWAGAGFEAGQTLRLNDTLYEIASVSNDQLLLAAPGITDEQDISGRAEIVDSNNAEGTLMGGDHITVLGGGGSQSPLVVFGDTSESGAFYAGNPAEASAGMFGDGDTMLSYPLANPFQNEGHDTIDASALFASVSEADLPSVGVSIYGGGGNDLIIGSPTGDHLAGGAGDDTIYGEAGQDHIYGDSGLNIDPVVRSLTVPTTDYAGQDLIFGGTEEDIIFGDHGIIAQAGGTVRLLTTGNVISAETAEPANGDDDVIDSGDHNDWVFGGHMNDRIVTGTGDDVAFGDHGYIDADTIHSSDLDIGGDDIIYAGMGEDIVIGGSANDMLDGGQHDDLIFGDSVHLDIKPDATNPRFRSLSGTTLFNDQGESMVDTTQQFDSPDNVAVWARWEITDLNQSFTIEARVGNNFGNDYIAGGADDDMIFGQLGEDVIQGDGSIILADQEGIFVGASRASDGSLILSASFDADSDGADYIEGNGGNDVIFGNLGQDDIIGGSSDQFSLDTDEQRPDGEDVLFGGSGTMLDRNAIGDESEAGHARDADVILGDNGSIFRIVDAGGVYLTFNYDNYTNGLAADQQLHIIPRSYDLLDYTIGGADSDIGGSDLVYGGTGDDIIHGMAGNDVLYGNGRDDDLYGGAGHDTLFGGSGEDGMMGDDGLLRTARNGTDEPLYGLEATTESLIDIPGPFTGAIVDIEDRIKKTAVILQPDTITFDTEGGFHDIMYGGLGDDWMHGGYGNDAMSGAEALSTFYRMTLPQTEIAPIGYDPESGKLSYYDADNPLAKIDGFFLNFQAVDSDGNIIEDGKDRLFGDTGHDWLVGGTGHDRLFGGSGDDLINADDYLETNGGANDTSDHSAWGDFAYGGGGRDVLIANSGFDRLFDWGGEYNSFIVPFSRFGLPSINRLPSPLVIEFLTQLGDASGADTRLTEPNGELGLVTQADDQWQDQVGAPRDPQPGNGHGEYDNDGGPEDDRDKIITADGSTPGGRPPLFTLPPSYDDPVFGVASDVIITVDEDDLPAGTDGIQSTSQSAGIGFTAGSANITQISFDSDLSGVTVSGLNDGIVIDWVMNAEGTSILGSITGSGPVLQIDLGGPLTIVAGETAMAVVTVTLLAPLPHEDDVDADSLTISGITVTAIDTDNMSVSGSVSIIVVDDEPVVDILPAVIDSTPTFDGVKAGDTLNGSWDSNAGADGDGSVGLMVNGVAEAFDSEITVMEGSVTVGALTVAADGSWQFTASETLGSESRVDFEFAITIIDSDGDTATDIHEIGVGDRHVPDPVVDPVTADALQLTLNEDDLSSGTDQSDPVIVSGDISFTAGTYDLTSFVFADNPEVIVISGLDDLAVDNWVRSDDGMTLIGSIAGIGEVISLTIGGDALIKASKTGQVTITATLLAAFPHEDAPDADSLTINGLQVIALDAKGNSAVGSVSVTVIDDEPLLSLDGAYVGAASDPYESGKGNNGVGNGEDPQPAGDPPINDDTADEPGDPGNQGGPDEWDEASIILASSSTGSTDYVESNNTLGGNWSGTSGADSDADFAVIVNGITYGLDEDILVMQGDLQLGTLRIGSDGTWSFVAASGLVPETSISFDFTLVVVDGDGDMAALTHSIGLVAASAGDTSGKANNGVGNGKDPQPKGDPPLNDGEGDVPGDPGNEGGDVGSLTASTLDSSFYTESEPIIVSIAAGPTPTTVVDKEIDILYYTETGELIPAEIAETGTVIEGEEWTIV